MLINLLPEEIVNQIAAGEVIENPSAVIKELVENSIDAGADNIEVEIENSGIKRITVKDNGCGISKDDLLKAPLRHATSKIKSFSDLYNIKTMGFRGEALASIFSVAKSRIISKREDDVAYEITSENKTQVKESACQNGTCIHIEDLFYNTPARRKYLRSENMELKAILDVMNRFEVYYHNIKFTLKHNGKILINKPLFKTPEDNIFYVLGKELRENLLYFEKRMDGIKVNGFLGKPSNISYPFRKNQYMYVNSRYVKSKLVRDAIYEGFGTNLMEGRHPFFVAFIDIDPEIIDVNVHPTKIEIRFENELEIYEFMRNAIKEVFEKNETFKPFEKIEVDTTLDKSIEDVHVRESEVRKERGGEKTYFSKETQRVLSVRESETEYEGVEMRSEIAENMNIKESYDFRDDMTDENSPVANQVSDSESLEFGPLYETLKDYRIVGQINKTFIILETPKEMIIVDQHVAEEKFFFETFKEQVESTSVKSQVLLKPEMISLTNQEMLLYKDNLELIEKLGFKTEEFGSNEIVVRAVPVGIQEKIVNAQTLKDIIHEITVDKKFKLLEEEKLEKLASMSCKRSIKAGHEMTTPEIHRMIENLKKLKEPFNCPHGRPILLNWSFTELEKKFKRIV